MRDDTAPDDAATPPPSSESPAWETPPPGTPEAGANAPEPGTASGAGAPQAAPAGDGIDVGRGLRAWLGILLVFGAGGLLLGQQEMALLVVIAGVFIAAQAADLDSRWEWLYRSLLAVVVVFTALAFLAIALTLRQLDLPPGPRNALFASALVAAGVSLFTLHIPFANAIVRALFRVSRGSHTLRLAARLTLFGLLFAVPGWFATRELFETLMEDPSRLFEELSLGGGLIGYVLLALAAVGFLIRRDLAGTLGRLGIQRLTLAEVAFVVAGAALLFALNGTGEALQRNLFPALWAQDRRMTEAIAGELSRSAAVMVGLSAGIGEEITLRGGLQPKLGILLTATLFASLHVQYSWFGMLMIFVFGCVLGVIRARTHTTVAIGVHTLYDVVALLLT